MESKRITLSAHQREILEKIIIQRTSRVRDVERSKIILALSGDVSTAEVQKIVGESWLKIQKCRRRWLLQEDLLQEIEAKGTKKEVHSELWKAVVASLQDSPRSGSPGKFSSLTYCRILGVALESPADSGVPISEWTLSELKREVEKRGIVESISRSQLGNFLKSGGSKAAQNERLADAQV